MMMTTYRVSFIGIGSYTPPYGTIEATSPEEAAAEAKRSFEADASNVGGIRDTAHTLVMTWMDGTSFGIAEFTFPGLVRHTR